ncbi:TPA: chromosome partitioning protein ParB, partial [Candidatus Saccharibacteria bacterium]|nr:chromosome partitioning protein ParB [Candidatus Saccharibacteria bacterium]
AGKTSIPALVRPLSAQHKLELSLIENIQRRDLNPLETATAYEKLRVQFNLTLEEIGMRVGGKSVSAISNTLRLLKLPDAAKQAVAKGELSEGQARPLIGLTSADVDALLPQIIREGWSARKIEQAMRDEKPATAKKPPTERMVFEQESNTLTKHLGTAVRIKGTQKGNGTITISFGNQDELERIKGLLER